MDDKNIIISAWAEFYEQKGLAFFPISEVQKIRLAFFAGADAAIDALKKSNEIGKTGDIQPR